MSQVRLALIDLIQCNRCNLQHIGETKRRLKDRFNEHRRTIDNPNTKSKPTTAAEHFLSSPNHTANDMQLVPIEKIFSNRDSIRKAKEAKFITTTARPLSAGKIVTDLFLARSLSALSWQTLWGDSKIKVEA